MNHTTAPRRKTFHDSSQAENALAASVIARSASIRATAAPTAARVSRQPASWSSRPMTVHLRVGGCICLLRHFDADFGSGSVEHRGKSGVLLKGLAREAAGTRDRGLVDDPHAPGISARWRGDGRCIRRSYRD